MAQSKVYIDFLDNPLEGQNFSFKLLDNNNPVQFETTNEVNKTYLDDIDVDMSGLIILDKNLNHTNRVNSLSPTFSKNTYIKDANANYDFPNSTIKYIGDNKLIRFVSNPLNLKATEVLSANGDSELVTTTIEGSWMTVDKNNGDVFMQKEDKIYKYDRNLNLISNNLIPTVSIGGCNGFFTMEDGRFILIANTIQSTSVPVSKSLIVFNSEGILDSSFITNINAQNFTENNAILSNIYSIFLVGDDTIKLRVERDNGAVIVDINYQGIYDSSKDFYVVSDYFNLISKILRHKNFLLISGEISGIKKQGQIQEASTLTLLDLNNNVVTYLDFELDTNSSNDEVNVVDLVEVDGKVLVIGNFAKLKVRGSSTYIDSKSIALLDIDINGNIVIQNSNTSLNYIAPPVYYNTDINLSYSGAVYINGLIYLNTRLTSLGTALAESTVYTVPVNSSTVSAMNATLTNLQTFNTNPDVSYSIEGNSIVMTYEHNEDTIIVLDSVSDIPDRVHIRLSTTNTDAKFIMTKSPHFYNYFFAEGTVDTAKINMFIYKGNFNDPPTEPSYTFSKNIVLNNQTSMYFNVASYLDEYCNVDINNYMYYQEPIRPLITPVSNSEMTWARIDFESYYNTILVGSSSEKYLAIGGYGWVEEGANPRPGKILMTNTDKKILRYGLTNMYFVMKNLESFTYYKDSQEFTVDLNGFDTLLNTDYVVKTCLQDVGLDGVSKLTYVLRYSDDIVVNQTFHIIDECFYNPVEIFFKNKFGVLQSFPFEKKSVQGFNIEKENYNTSILNVYGEYDHKAHSTKTLNVNSSRKITINTGFLEDYQQEDFKQLMHSSELYLYDTVTKSTIPVEITTTSYDVKTRRNDQNYNYTIELKQTNKTINQVL